MWITTHPSPNALIAITDRCDGCSLREYAAKNMEFLIHLALSLGLWFHPGRGTLEIGNTLPLQRSPTLDQTVEQFVPQAIVKNGRTIS